MYRSVLYFFILISGPKKTEESKRSNLLLNEIFGNYLLASWRDKWCRQTLLNQRTRKWPCFTWGHHSLVQIMQSQTGNFVWFCHCCHVHTALLSVTWNIELVICYIIFFNLLNDIFQNVKYDTFSEFCLVVHIWYIAKLLNTCTTAKMLLNYQYITYSPRVPSQGVISYYH